VSASTLWYLSRGTGIVSLLLLTGSVLLGIVTSVRWMSDLWPRFATTFLHRNISMLAVVFLVAHIATVVLDGFAPIGWKDAVVPFASAYRPLWLGFGAVAFDLVLALVATSLLRNRIGPRTWRLVHWLAYVCWPFAIVHGLATGSDTTTLVVLALDAACVVAVCGAIWWRIRSTRIDRPALRSSTLAVTVVAPLALLAWLFWGPLAAHWAERAGTPASLLGHTATASDTSASPAAAVPPSSAPQAALSDDFAARYTGTISRSSGADGQETLEFDTTLDDPSSSSLVIVLRGTDRGSGLVVQRGTATITSQGERTLFVGAITSISGDTLVAAPSADSASSSTLAIAIHTLDNATQRVSGTVTTTEARER